MDLAPHHAALPQLPLLEALLLHLDTTPPTPPAPGLALDAWQAAGGALHRLAARVLPLPAALAEARGEVAEVAALGWAHHALGAAAATMQRCHDQLECAVGEWRRACELLAQREWWAEAHLRLLGAPLQGGGAPEALAAVAVVGAAQLVALEAAHHVHLHLGAALGGESAWERPILWGPAGAPAVVAAALRRHGADALAERVEAASAAFLAAQEADQELRRGQGRAAASLASMAAAATAFEAGAGGEWAAPEQGWQPVPLGAAHPELGPIAPLPPTFWRAFPAVRRREAQARDAAREAAARAAEAARGALARPTALASPPARAQPQRPAGGGGASQDPVGPALTPLEGVGSQPTQRRVRFQDQELD